MDLAIVSSVERCSWLHLKITLVAFFSTILFTLFFCYASLSLRLRYRFCDIISFASTSVNIKVDRDSVIR